MCLAKGPQRSDAGEARTRGPIGLESSTLPLRSLSNAKGGGGLGGPGYQGGQKIIFPTWSCIKLTGIMSRIEYK